MSKKSKSNKFPLRYLGQALYSLIAPWKQIDWLLLFLVVGLTSFGGLTIYSIERVEELNHAYQHLTIGCLGLGIAIAIARLNYRSLLQWHWVIYVLTNASLIAVMVAGVTAKGAQRWISLAGFNVQPVQYYK